MCNSGILCGCSYVILITLLQLALISHDKYAVVFNADSRAVINIQANGISSEVFEQAGGGGIWQGECGSGERKDTLMLALEARVKTRIKDRRYTMCSLSLSLCISFSFRSLYYIFYLSALDRDDFR